MKIKKLISALTFLTVFTLALPAQEKKIKTGFDHVPYPVLGIDDDLGFQYGLHYSLVYYGDGSAYPNYKHKLMVEGSRYTKGQIEGALTYQSDYLIPGIRFYSALAYKKNPMAHFYGFNGFASPVDKSLDRKDGIAYYDINREFIRAAATFQGKIAGSLIWCAGINFLSYRIDEVDAKYDYDPKVSLYHDYINQGIIHPDEANGGKVMEFSAGVVYDSRDAISMPTKGIWSELYCIGAPDIFKSGYGYMRLSAHMRQYISVFGDDRLVFAYHVGWQEKIAGEQPFYVIQNINTVAMTKSVNEGLGNKNNLRITRKNRLAGEGYAWANVEARIKIVQLESGKQTLYIGTNPFFDCGAITSPYRLEAARGSDLYKEATRLHMAAGLGMKFVLNRNTISSWELAKPFNRDDGNWKVLISANFAF